MKYQRGITTTLILYGLAALAVVAAIAGIYYAGHKAGAAEVQLEWNEAVDSQALAELQQSGEASKSLEGGNAKARVIYRTITQSVDKYIDRDVYRNVCFDSDGLRDANAALLGTTTPPAKLDSTVPPASGPARWFRGLGAPRADSAGGTVP